jgi:hypothetical protein
MPRLAGPLIVCALAFANAHAHAQAGATPAPLDNGGDAQTPAASAPNAATAQAPTTDDICRTLEQAAAENALPVEFFARVIWQESRFNANAVSQKGAQGIAQFMPRTASQYGLVDPFDPIEALRHSAAYLHELLDRFGNLGLAAAAYDAGPGRVSAWLASHRGLPDETRNYVALVTGWTADEWASSPPAKADTTIPQGVPCTRLANLILAPRGADRDPHSALGCSACGARVGKHGLGDLPRQAEAIRPSHRGSRTHRCAQGNSRHGQGQALHHHHCGRRSRAVG